MKVITDSNVSQAIKKAKLHLNEYGRVSDTTEWQSTKSSQPMWEFLDLSMVIVIPQHLDYRKQNGFQELAELCKAQIPWAVEHLFERVGGAPVNPGETYKLWKYYKNKPSDDKFRTDDEKFSHTYMERFWAKQFDKDGIRFKYGDLSSIIELLKHDPTTRQAYLPVYFPEDTGLSLRVPGKRVPCTLGYHFLIRDNHIHCNYYIRSCDAIRHFNDDVFLAMGLTIFIMNELLNHQPDLKPGFLKMHIGSFHCFKSERELLKVVR